MESVFGPDDQEMFEVVRDRLVASFVEWGGAGFERVAEQVFDFKWGYLDGDLRNWSVADVEEVLFGLYPAKVLIDAEGIAEVPAGFAALLRFLADDRTEHALPMEELAAYVERSMSRFVAAMNDENNWSFGKRMWSTALADGVDLSDEAAVGSWVEGFSTSGHSMNATRSWADSRPPATGCFERSSATSRRWCWRQRMSSLRSQRPRCWRAG